MNSPEQQPSLLLAGMMGSGKTTVGRLVATVRGVPFIDLDDEIARAVGISLPDIFARLGEASFRALEREALRAQLDAPGPRVIALGGGALLDPEVRREALARACVVSLVASPRTLAERIGGPGRPLLDAAPDRAARLREILAERAPVYAEAHARVSAELGPPAQVAEAVLRAYRDRPLLVPLGARTYGVRVAAEPFRAIADAARALAPTAVFVVTDETVAGLWGAPLRAALEEAGLRPAAIVVLPPGEQHKRLASVEAALAAMVEAGADRGALVIGHGGGVVTDMAGFAAAALLRGVRWIAAPTTLLAMVDASVGGKTGVDLGEAKNAVGAFHQPSAVVLGPAQLATEPARQLRSGLAEAVKAACLGDPALFEHIEREAERVLDRDPAAIEPVIRGSVEVKIAIVSCDEREEGDRALLNFGHTLGHALEAEGRYTRLLHGEAVSLGMVAMLRAGAALGITAPAASARVVALLERIGLPTRLDEQPVEAALRLLALDKKRRGGLLRAVLLRDVGQAVIRDMPLDQLAELLAAAAR